MTGTCLRFYVHENHKHHNVLLYEWLLEHAKKIGITAGASAPEELVQEVMAVLWHRAHLYDPSQSSLSTWLYRIARNRRIDRDRRAKHRQIEISEYWFCPPEVPSADILLERAESDARVRAALENIPDEQMQLVRAAFFLGQTHSEIASSTGIPLGTVKSRIRLAFERLRKALEEPASLV